MTIASPVSTKKRQLFELLVILAGGFIVFAGCKKIRDDEGLWQQIELYFHTHADVNFSHGLCPDCAKKLYPDIADDIMVESNKHRPSSSLE